MRTSWAVVLSSLCCAQAALASPVELEKGTQLLEPILAAPVAVFPIVRTSAEPEDATVYLSLAAGLERKEVRVRELGEGGDVNRVRVTNRSDRPLLLLGGELILGGQQDRIIGQDTIVPAKSTALVGVFCVEHGRWDGRADFGRAGGIVDANVKRRAKFTKDQSAVWNEVAKKVDALGARSASGTYGALEQKGRTPEQISKLREVLVPALAAHPDQARFIGLAAAVNGKIVSVDVFANHALFEAHRAQLIDSIVYSGADAPKAAVAKPPPAPAKVKEWVEDAEAAPEQVVERREGSRTVNKAGRSTLNSTVETTPAAGAPATKILRSYQAVE